MRYNANLARKANFVSAGTVSKVGYVDKMQAAQTALIEREKRQLLNNLESVRFWAVNWDGKGSAKPSITSFNYAKKWLNAIFDLGAELSLEWVQPLISADEEGQIVVEWWNGSKKLTLDFDNLMVEYTKISNIKSSPKIINGTMGGCAEYNKKEKIRPVLEWILE